ncbi:MAG: hypothetical protein IC227_01440 [Enterococcus lacertideformus]|uniref:WxL domain-containing protein n=1 Tax=Enterococcus lacertideformus TaxID=2771493 RepID=A0A931AXD6_9ENTE|nr:hypothetical protein [Enterococcus lacertideformus]
MAKKYTCLFIGACLSFFLIASPITFADTTTSTVTGEIISGEFSMTMPNDLNFQATLNGQKQALDLQPIKTKITDYRGQKEGWQLTVKSPNFETYAQNYQLIINDQSISHNESIVYKQISQSLIKEISLPVQVEVLASAKAGSYSVDLEWNLQPTINIKE